MGKTIYVCNGHMCGNLGTAGGKCGCCPDGVMVRYVETPEDGSPWRLFDEEPPIGVALLIKMPSGERYAGKFSHEPGDYDVRYRFEGSGQDFVVGEAGDEVPADALMWMAIPDSRVRDALELVQTYGTERVLLFHGYPQHKDAHRSRPWWRVKGGLCRPDGVSVSMVPTFFHGHLGPPAHDAQWIVWPGRDERHELPFKGWDAEDAVLVHVDRYWPLPEPPLLPGQVWVDEVTGRQSLIGLVDEVTGSVVRTILTGMPSPGAVLVYGPSCYGPDVPWAPPGWSAPTSKP